MEQLIAAAAGLAIVAFCYFVWLGRQARALQSAQQPLSPLVTSVPSPLPKEPSTVDRIDALRASIRAEFEQREAEKDAAVGLTDKKAVMADARAFLVKADAARIIDGFLREARNWGSWQSRGKSEYVPDEVVTTDYHSERDEKGGSRTGYTFTYDGRGWSFEMTQGAYSNFGGGSTYHFGQFRVRRGPDLVFECGISEDFSREFSDWHANLESVTAFTSADWLVDFAAITELGRNLREQRQRERERSDALARAEATTWRPPGEASD